jgi:hypothetical protein
MASRTGGARAEDGGYDVTSTMVATMLAGWLMVIAGLAKRRLELRPPPPWPRGASGWRRLRAALFPPPPRT